MKSWDYARISVLAVALALGGCDTAGTFTGNHGGGPGLGGGGGGGGGGGVPGVTTEPNMQYGPNDVVGFGGLKISGDAGEIVFVDDGDPTANNPNGDWQLFSYSIGTGNVTQITDGSANAVPALFDFDLTDNGDSVVWASTEDFVGTNANNQPNIFLGSTSGGGISQVTAINAGLAFNPQVSGNGLVVFLSFSDLTGDNPAGDDQIFIIGADGSNLRQVTSESLVPRALSFADGGTKIAFESRGDPFATNADTTIEIFVIDTDGSNLTQVTATDGDSLEPRLSDDGSAVAFVSRAEVVAGGNPDGNYEVFVALTDGSVTVQISNGDSDSGTFASGSPGAFDMAGNGSYVVFTSESDLTGENNSQNHTIYTAPAGGGIIAQTLRDGTVADGVTTWTADQPTIDNSGLGLAFESSINLTSTDQPGFDKIYTTIRQ